MVQVHVVEGFRKGSGLYYIGDGHYYYVNRHLGRFTLSLRCIKYRSEGCCGRAVCSQDRKLFRVTKSHNGHLKSKSLAESRMLRTKILQKCASGIPARFSHIVHEESRGFSSRVRIHNTAVKLRSSMRRSRLQFMPNSPHTFGGVHAMLTSESYKHLTMTLSGDSYMYVGMSGEAWDRSRSLIFMSNNMKGSMAKATKIFSDGTQNGIPSVPPCSQVFSILTTWDNQIVPLCIALMQRRNATSYLHLLKSLSHLVPQWKPQTINCDFESAQIKSWKEIFPSTRVVGCLYHYSKDVSEYARGLGFSDKIANDPIFASLVRRCLAIPLVPRLHLKESLKAVMMAAHQCQYFEDMENFFAYLYNEWVTKRESVLSVYDVQDRTSNVAESWNSKMQHTTCVAHPNFFHWIRAMLTLEDGAQQNIFCMLRGVATNRPRKVSAVNNDKAIKLLTVMWMNNHININDFLRRASYRLSAHFRKVFLQNDDSSESE